MREFTLKVEEPHDGKEPYNEEIPKEQRKFIKKRKFLNLIHAYIVLRS